MTNEEMSGLRKGQTVRNIGSGSAYLITTTTPKITAMRTVEVSNPDEWEIVKKCRIDTLSPGWGCNGPEPAAGGCEGCEFYK